MPANDRWGLIRRLKINLMYVTVFSVARYVVLTVAVDYSAISANNLLIMQ